MALLKKLFTLTVLGLFLLSFSACTDSEEKEETVEKSTEAVEMSKPQIGNVFEAVDLVIFFYSFNRAIERNLSMDIPQSLYDRISKYDDKLQYNDSITGVKDPLIIEKKEIQKDANGRILVDGIKNEIPVGSQFIVNVSGVLNANIQIESGEIGIIDGKIYVGEGTKLVINGEKYIYSKGRWSPANKGANQ